jgi:hypothetical protein
MGNVLTRKLFSAGGESGVGVPTSSVDRVIANPLTISVSVESSSLGSVEGTKERKEEEIVEPELDLVSLTSKDDSSVLAVSVSICM